MNSEKRRGVRAARSGKASGGVVEELLGLRLQFEPRVLTRLAACDRGDALDEVEHALRLSPFLGEHRLDDLGGFRLREPALAQELGSVLVGVGDDLRPRRLDAVHERRGAGVREPR